MQDSLRFAESMPRRKDSYLAVPLYDFFDRKLAPRIQKNGFSLSTYESLWDLSWKRPLFSSPLDIAVPSRLTFAVSRSIKTSPQDISDMLQFKTGAGFTAFNCFGSFGSAHLWNWYEQDEYASFMSLTFKADRSQIKKYRIDFSGYNQVLFFFNAKDNLRLFTEYRIDTARDWQTKFTVEWDRLGKTSIVKDGLEFLLLQFNKAVKNEKNFSVGLRRKNAFNAVIGNTEADILMQNYVLSHNVDFELNSYLRTGLFLTAEVSIRNTMGAAGQNAGTTAFSLKNSGGISAKLTF